MMLSNPSSSNTTNPIALLRKLEWRVRHAADSVLKGEYRSAFRGQGMEFDQVVPYEFGDDVRDIDWNVTARLGEPYRKKFIEEREITLLLLFEDSPSLQFGSGSRTKREALMEIAGLITLLSAVNRDRVALFYQSPTVSWYQKPARGKGAILHSASKLLSQPQPNISNLPDQSQEIPWKFLAHAAPRHSIFIWLSDFPSRTLPASWPAFKNRYKTMGFRIDDPWERKLPAMGEMTAFDPLTGELVVLNTNSSAQQKAHREWNHKRQEYWTTLFNDPLSRMKTTTEENQLDALIRFFKKRMHLR